MKAISLSSVSERAVRALVRFPFVILAGLVATVATIGDTDDMRWIFVPILGIGFLYALAIAGERLSWGMAARTGTSIAGVLILVLYGMLVGDLSRGGVELIRYGLFVAAAHLLVAIAPCVRRGGVNGFWQYNKALFIRFLASALYTGVLLIGVELALVAINALFHAEIEGNAYRDIAVFFLCLVNTWFFVAGTPEDFDALDAMTDYPRALKAFVAYVLLPLITLYMLILYAYGLKIIVEWEWPHGWVSSLILGFSGVGVLSFLLLAPIRSDEGNRWIGTFARWFHRCLLPLIVLLLLAVLHRIDNYGLTESRYLVFAGGIWLAGITIYYLIRPNADIRPIPISLCLVVLATSIGPWGAIDVSVASQHTRLERMLTDVGILADGHIVATAPAPSDSVGNEIASIVRFLDDHKRLGDIEPWFSDSLKPLDDSKVLTALHVPGYDYRNGGPYPDVSEFLSLDSPHNAPLQVSGYDFAIPFSRSDDSLELDLEDGGHVNISYRDETGILIVQRRGEAAVTFPLARFVRRLQDSLRAVDSVQALASRDTSWRTITTYGPSYATTLMTASSAGGPIQVVVENASGARRDSSMLLTAFTLHVLMGHAKPVAPTSSAPPGR